MTAGEHPADERLARLRLIRSEGVGPVGYRSLLARFGDALSALEAMPGLARARGRVQPLRVTGPDEAERELEGLARADARLILLGEALYPPLLALLPDAPPVLSVLGDATLLACRGVGIVGARNASSNGLRMAEMLAGELVAAGLVVVSGLARGIDAAAQRAALAVAPQPGSSGPTIACIAGGLDKPYPPENVELQAEIARTGCVVTEAPFGTVPQARHFPRRNRLIAGLALGTVVIEAAAQSGSLITARLAVENGREVFAVPGSPLDPRSRGANNLLRQGAVLTEGIADILRELPNAIAAGQPAGFAEAASGWGGGPEDWVALDAVRDRVLVLLGPVPAPIDDVVRRTGASAAAVLTVLTELELAGRVETLPGHRVCRIGV